MRRTFYSRFFFSLVFGLLLSAAPLIAGESEDALDPYADRQIYYRAENQPALNDLLGAAELEAYRAALAADDCDPAYALLTNAYARHFPDAPHPGSSWLDETTWIGLVGMRHYPELSLCIYLRDIRETSAEIDRLGLEIPRYKGVTDRANFSKIVILRNYALSMLMSFTGQDFAPAFLALARLSEDGKVIRFTSEYQYFLALRARHFGLDTRELDDLIRATEKRLDSDAIPELRRRAQLSYFEPGISQYR